MEVDVLAIGPHPDDIEIGAGGSLLLWRSQGYRIGLVDLTRGELGSRGNADKRIAESREAARRLDASFRVNLGLTDGSVTDGPAERECLVSVIRGACPSIVLANLEEGRHPDHSAGARLTEAAFFLSRLPKYQTGQPSHSPQALFHYLIHEQAKPSFLVDVSPVFEGKFDTMRAYESQFLAPALPDGYRHTGLWDYLQNVRSLGEAWGAQAGVKAAEAFVSSRPLLVKDIAPWVKG